MITLLMVGLLQVSAETPVAPAPLPAWMAGCWMSEAQGTQTEECWTAPRGDMLLGSSHVFVDAINVTQPGHRTSDEVRTVSFEHMRIVREGGTLVFIAQPGGAPPTRFPASVVTTRNGEENLIFANSGHDYPQRISYRYVHARHWELTAEISMADGSRPQRWTFRRPS
jgi:hypothetical protein